MTIIHKLNNKKQNKSWSDVEGSGVIELISQYQLAKVLTSLYKTGLIKKLKDIECIDINTFNGFNNYLLTHLFNYLKIHNILYDTEKGYCVTIKGKAIFSDESIAQLCFYSEAYDNITSNINNFLNDNLLYGRDIIRDGKSLGIHCDTLFKEYHTESMVEALKHLECKKILDVGCGGGQFLIDLCAKNPKLTGIGLDISEPAISHANKAAEKQNLSARLNYVVADAFDLSTWPQECFGADVLCGSGVVHEHFRDGEKSVIDILNTYASLLTNNDFKAIILGEPEIRYDLLKSDADLYLVHIFTAQGFPRHCDEWLELFEKTNLQCNDVYTRPSAGPRFNFFVLTLK